MFLEVFYSEYVIFDVSQTDISKNEIEKAENWHMSVFLAPRQANILFETANYVFTKLMLY